MARILVTGGAGFVGSHLVAVLGASGWEVRAAVRSAGAVLPAGVDRAVVGDVASLTDLGGALADVDAVVHLAARVHLMRYRAADPEAEFRRANLEATDVHVTILGDGAFRARLGEMAADCGASGRLHLLDPVDKAPVQDFLTRMDLLYLGLQHQPLFRFGVSPTKLNDYLLAGRPILHAIDAPPDVMGESGAGLSVPAEDSAAIAQAIQELQRMPREAREDMGRRGRAWVLANRDYRVLARRFMAAVEEVRRR